MSSSLTCSPHLHTFPCLFLLPQPLSSITAHSPFHPLLLSPSPRRIFFPLRASKNPQSTKPNEAVKNSKQTQKAEEFAVVIEVVEGEEYMSRFEETALEAKEYTASMIQAIPGPRVAGTNLPWMLALPLGYVGVAFVIAFVKTVLKFNSPKGRRQRQVNKNAVLCKSIDDLLQKGGEKNLDSGLKRLKDKTGFSTEEILRKYIRYALNEKPFNPDMVASLIQLRKASQLEDSQSAEILNEISRRIVAIYGPVVMDISGYSEAGFKKKLAVQALFGKVLYLSELPEFSTKDNSLIVKEIFGVTDEDVDELRTSTFSEAGDVDSLEKLIDEDSEDSDEKPAEPK
ncbi:hypothetical protein Droror1_Dr00017446 [Drosera rotundifolia]